MLKERLRLYKDILRVVWNKIIIVVFYVMAMWALLVAALYLFLEDFWKAAGIVSALILFRITQSEFYKEFFGSRSEGVVANAIQKQSKRD